VQDSFADFTNRARRALEASEQQARRVKHSYVSPEHLLLGVLENSGSGACKVLTTLGVDVAKVRSSVEFIVGHGEKGPVAILGLSPAGKRVIHLAHEEAMRLGQNYLGTEHLLLGIMRQRESIAAGVLESLGLSLARVRSEVAAIVHPIESAGLGKSTKSLEEPVYDPARTKVEPKQPEPPALSFLAGCSACERQLAPNWAYCPYCGTKCEPTCPNCDAPLPDIEGAIYCHNCGERL
jgi:ATP-dependent Clp protease ATP-binding subunit ClpC